MILPSIYKTKPFDFKAMKSNRPPSPSIDPYFFSPRARRRRAAKFLEAKSCSFLYKTKPEATGF